MKRPSKRTITTFPLSPVKLRMRLTRSILFSPLTWLPFLAVLNLWLNKTFSSMAAVLSILAITSGLIFFYGITLHSRKKKIIKRLIKQSNQEQDEKLFRRAFALAENGAELYSHQLIEFVKLKNQIESTIHEGEGMTSRREEIDTLVDTIAFAAADQFEKLAEIDARLNRKRSKPVPPDVEQHFHQTKAKIAAQLRDAYATLAETWENLGEWFDHDALPDSHHPGMDAALTHLKIERDIAYRVRDRMDSDWAAEFPEAEDEMA